MQAPIAFLGTPHMGFFALIVIGGLAGWIGGKIVGVRHSLLTNILVGIVGSWVGSEVAGMAGVAMRGSMAHFLAALVGSIVVLVAWQLLEGRSGFPGSRLWR